LTVPVGRSPLPTDPDPDTDTDPENPDTDPAAVLLRKPETITFADDFARPPDPEEGKADGN
jgi:hypothetical protein